MGTARIMVVEDDVVISMDLKASLVKMGYEVCAAFCSGEEAVEAIGSANPDLVLMDMRLKGEMSGVDAARQIHQEHGTPLIFLTAYSDSPLLEEARLTEPFGYLLKPYREDCLRTAIEIALYKAEMQEQLRQSEERFRGISASALDAIILLEPTGEITFWNPAAERMFGYSRAEALDRTMDFVVVSGSTPQSWIEGFSGCDPASPPEGDTREIDCVRKNGEIFPAEVSFSTLRLGESWHAVWIVRDISERVRLEKERGRLIDDLTKALAEVKTLSGLLPICSHCKSIRDDDGYWRTLESYIASHSQADFSHGICPDCVKKYYPQVERKKQK